MEKWIFFLIALVAVTSAQNSSSSSIFGELPQGNYNASKVDTASAGTLQTLFDMAQGFVNVVFKPFSDLEDFIVTVTSSEEGFLNYLADNWQEAAKFEAGYIACLVFGLLFLIFVPLVGAIMCCCRCCDNCGGQLKQSQKRSKSCWRQCYCVAMLLLTVLMLIPTVFVFLTNEWVVDVVETGPAKINTVLDDFSEYVKVFPRQIEYATDQYSTVDAKVRPLVSDFGQSVGVPLQKEIEAMAKDSFEAMDEAIQVVDDTISAINAVDASLSELSGGMGTLNSSLQSLQSDMSTNLDDPVCTGNIYCNAVYESRTKLEVGFDIADLVGLRTDLKDVNDSLNSYDLNGMRENVTTEINDIPKETGEQTATASADALAALNDAQSSISDIQSNLPTDSFETLDQKVEEIQSSLDNIFSFYDDNVEKWVYIGGIVLGSILAFVCACYFLGVLLGVCGSESKVAPTQRKGTANCGGILLMVGVGFSFIFAALFMVLVIVAFSVGGHTERYGCQGLDPPKYEALGVVENITGLNLEEQLGLPSDVSLTFSEILTACEGNAAAYQAFKLEHVYNVTAYLGNVTQKTSDLEEDVNGVVDNIDLNTIKIYSKEDQADLLALKESGIEGVDFSGYLEKLGGDGVTKTNLTEYALFLREAGNNLTSSALNPFKLLIMDYADEVDRIQRDEAAPLQDDYNTLNESIYTLIQQSAILNTTIDTLDDSLGAFNATFQAEAKSIIISITDSIVDQVVGNITAYTDWVGKQVTDNMGACRPIYDSYTATVAVLCDYLVDTINGLWFSLGWCCFFLIPSAIVAMKLMKFYRRMTYDDEFDERRQYSFLG